jgi:protein-disulfide isomerase
MRRDVIPIFLAALAGAGLGAGAVALSQGDLLDRRIRDYVLAHPEIIPEAMKKLEVQTAARTLSRHRAALEAPFAGAWAGAARPDVTLVMFSDYRCGYCRASLPVVDRLLAEDKGLRVVWREIPILGPQSEVAARAALNAATKGRYLAVHRSLFATGTSDVPPADTPEIAREIAANIAIARDLGISGTPSFVIGGQLLQGAVGYDALKRAIAQARAARV